MDIELETTLATRFGNVIIPHVFGLTYNGEVYGVNVNQLTKSTHRDPIAGTPLHVMFDVEWKGSWLSSK